MHSKSYKECLEGALTNLEEANQNIFNSMLDILMQGEMKDWNNEVPIGEVHNFDFELFKNSEDTNIFVG